MAKPKPKKAPPAPVAENQKCTVRVTRMGDGKVSNGVHHPGVGDEYYEANEEFKVAADIAYELQDRGYVEIQGEAPPRPKKPKERPAEKEEDGVWQG